VTAALANVPNAGPVAAFITNQIQLDEFVLDALVTQLQNTASNAGTDFGQLDALLANDVLQLTSLAAQFEIQALGANGNTGTNGG
jgi:hypothetical protein